MYLRLTFLLIILLVKFSWNKLLSVIEINRHGARTPNNFEDMSSDKFFGASKMQLTINGYRQQMLLGEYVKSNYVKKKHFLKNYFNDKEFEIIASPSQRTIFSSAGYIAGLYPEYVLKMNYDNEPERFSDDTIPIVNNEMTIKEIPLRVIDQKHDSFFHPLNCLYYGKKLESLLKEYATPIFNINDEEYHVAIDEMKNFIKIKDLEEEVSKSIKKKSDEGVSTSSTYINYAREIEKFYAPMAYHFPNSVPKITLETQKILKKSILNRQYSPRSVNNQYLRLSASEIFDFIKNMFSNAILSTKEHNKEYMKFAVLSGHDTNLVNILSNLLDEKYLVSLVNQALDNNGIFKFLIPPFASNMFFELHQDDQNNDYFYVKIIYNGAPLSQGLKTLETKDVKENKIELSRFLNLLNYLIEKDYSKLDCLLGKGKVKNKMKLLRN
jgi:hypothetical protein